MAIERNQSISAEEMKTALSGKVNTSDALTYAEIRDTTDLTGRVSSAEATKSIINRLDNTVLNLQDVYTNSSFTLTAETNSFNRMLLFVNYLGNSSVNGFSVYVINFAGSAEKAGFAGFPGGSHNSMSFTWENGLRVKVTVPSNMWFMPAYVNLGGRVTLS